ncbi:hypothetical protein RP20_CCG010975 [Aedes albopictus]|nr:hypothetical protein RP20_CCG010975 [Aedes albopictus]
MNVCFPNLRGKTNPQKMHHRIGGAVQASTHVDFMDGAVAVRVPFCCRSPAAAAVLVLTCGGLSFVRRLLLLSADDVELSVVDAAVRACLDGSVACLPAVPCPFSTSSPCIADRGVVWFERCRRRRRRRGRRSSNVT